jgi:hypothetical protein
MFLQRRHQHRSPPSDHIPPLLASSEMLPDTKGPFRGLLLDLLLQFAINRFPFDNVLDTSVMGSDNPALKVR